VLNDITPVLLTYNEAPNIGRTLAKLSWAGDIVVVDSGSSDDTLAIVAQFPQARVFHRQFDSHAEQWRFATQGTDIKTAWILRLDADYQLTDELIKEMAALSPARSVSAYRIAFDYAIYGHKIVSSLYPPNTVLLRNGRFAVVDHGHTEQWTVTGDVVDLTGRIVHDDRKPLSQWFASQQRYAKKEADYLLAASPRTLSYPDRLRRMGWPAPLLVFAYVLIVKRCLFAGWPGWFYALQRLLAECMIALEVIDRRLAGGAAVPASRTAARAPEPEAQDRERALSRTEQ
jgi:glycosyltransferase involved in cell wall biosynthesis